MLQAMIQTTNLITATCFQQSEIDSRKRPETVSKSQGPLSELFQMSVTSNEIVIS